MLYTVDGEEGIYDQNDNCIPVGADCKVYVSEINGVASFDGTMTSEGCSGLPCQSGGVVSTDGVCVSLGSSCTNHGTWNIYGECSQSIGSACTIPGENGATTPGVTTLEGCGKLDQDVVCITTAQPHIVPSAQLPRLVPVLAPPAMRATA